MTYSIRLSFQSLLRSFLPRISPISQSFYQWGDFMQGVGWSWGCDLGLNVFGQSQFVISYYYSFQVQMITLADLDWGQRGGCLGTDGLQYPALTPRLGEVIFLGLIRGWEETDTILDLLFPLCSTASFSEKEKSGSTNPLFSSAGQLSPLPPQLISQYLLNHCISSRLSWYFAFDNFSTCITSLFTQICFLIPNLSKELWSILRLLMNSQSSFAFQLILVIGTFPGQITSNIWQQIFPAPSVSIFVMFS